MTALLALVGVLALAVAGAVGWSLRAKPRMAALAAAFVILMSTSLYTLLGAPKLMAPLAEYHAQQQALEARIAERQAAVQDHPDTPETWAALGQAQMEAGAYAQATQSWKQAVIHSHGAPQMIREYAKAQIFAEGGTVTDEAKRGLDMVLLQIPGDPEARYFTALWHLQQGHAQEAMAMMKALYHDLPPDSPLRRVIDLQIGRE